MARQQFKYDGPDPVGMVGQRFLDFREAAIRGHQGPTAAQIVERINEVEQVAQVAYGLGSITPENLCAYMSPASWPFAEGRDRERWLADAERWLEAVRSLAAAKGPKVVDPLAALGVELARTAKTAIGNGIDSDPAVWARVSTLIDEIIAQSTGAGPR